MHSSDPIKISDGASGAIHGSAIFNVSDGAS